MTRHQRELDQTLFRYDERYARPHRRTNFFGWTITLLLLMGFALAAWLGSYYIFGQPERPDSYRILQKLQKIDPPKRFELTAAPGGEFLSPKQIYERYIAMRPAELAKKNAELTRNYIRNFQHVSGRIPYVVGRYEILDARELGDDDIFTNGMVALTRASDRGELLMEHLYPGNPQDVPLMKQTLATGLEIRLERTHDLSAIIRATRLPDGRLLITAVPLLYGSYTVTRGTATFSLEPPNDLNLVAGWPLFKEPLRRVAETRYERFRQGLPVETASPAVADAASAASAKETPAENELIRVAPAQAVGGETPAPVTAAAATASPVATATPMTVAKNETAPAKAPEPASEGEERVVAPAATPTPTPRQIAKSTPAPAVPPIVAPRAQPADDEADAVAEAEPEAVTPPTVLPAIPVPEQDNNSLASTAGGGSWRVFDPGKMPAGRLINPAEINEVAERGTAGERYYLRGQFVVNFVDANRAVLRPRGRLTDTVLRLAGAGSSTRVVVDFPAGYPLPAQGSIIVRDGLRPFEITEIRKQGSGQINVFAREIIRP